MTSEIDILPPDGGPRQLSETVQLALKLIEYWARTGKYVNLLKAAEDSWSRLPRAEGERIREEAKVRLEELRARGVTGDIALSTKPRPSDSCPVRIAEIKRGIFDRHFEAGITNHEGQATTTGGFIRWARKQYGLTDPPQRRENVVKNRV